MRALLRRLINLEKYSRSLPLTPENQEEFLSFCSLKFLEGRNIKTPNLMLYVDFMRWNLGRNSHKPSRHELTTYQTYEEIQDPRANEENIVNRLHASKQVKRIMQRLYQEDQLIIYFHYFDELSLREISEIFGVSESAVSQQHKKILSKIRNFISVANSELRL